ncbi:Uncharacterised protein [Nocardia otitidiscaviarum]|uniref:Integral membrane protein n=1 Tax=Nocardia otitidiscaviarum TaxID=1823 RepID=A0A378YPS6_9NOCA|nr:hypothetical protein [Nocardia otitidiscaviarum]MBF6182608.1 hypothetical protein [Nocardia otitidiscaviarum]MCP9623829.1 hypothetical protein [Nocardia otitidiscaviarum]QDP80874.1 hypothetical protein FOH10_21335 [Nocardia otitidiscaviarum]SUA79205.1 Uncharacterised protein [Nocardia otitidiscaviarum]
MTATTATGTRTIAGMSPLRLAYTFDGVATLASGILVAALAGVLDSALGLSTPLLLGVGAFFILYAIDVLIVATRPVISRRAAAVIIAVNALWAVDSLVVLAAGWLDPTALGVAAILVIAAFTAAMAAVQAYTLRADR